MKNLSIHFSSRSLLLGGPLLLLLSAPLWIGPFSSFLTPPEMSLDQTSGKLKAQQGLFLEELTFFQSEGEHQEVRLSAQQAFSENTDRQILLSGVAAELQNNRGQVISIKSREAIYDTPEQKVTLQHSVRLRSDDFTGSTELLNYYPEVKLAQTTREIKLSRPGLRIKGTGLNYDLGSGELVIGGYGRVYCSIE